MILNLYVEKQKLHPKDYKYDLSFKYINDSNNNIVAEGVHGLYSGTPTILKYDNNEYIFKGSPKKIDRIILNTRYPLCSKRKWTFGYYIDSNTDKNIFYYGEAITCQKKFLFKKNVGLTVINIDDKHYKVYRIGFFNEPHHYYSIHNENNKTIAVIKRLYGEEIRAKIYIEKEKDLFIALLACTQEVIDLIYYDADGHIRDKSSGNYTSLLEEEKQMLDKSFIDKFEKKL